MMQIKVLERLLGPTCALYLKSRVRWAVEALAASNEEAEDFEQDLLLYIYRHLPEYDPSRSTRVTYITRLILWGSRSLVAHQRAPKRDRTFSRSLTQTILDGESDEILRMEDIEDGSVPTRPSQISPLDLAIDLSRLMHHLPPASRSVCSGLGLVPLADIARFMKVERTTLYWYRNQIRKKAETLGLEKYLE